MPVLARREVSWYGLGCVVMRGVITRWIPRVEEHGVERSVRSIAGWVFAVAVNDL